MENSFVKKKIKIVIQITCVFWIIAKLISYKLWISDRTFPLIPIFDFLAETPNSIHTILFYISIIGISSIVFFQHNRLLISTLIIEFFSCLLDQTRWQPWEYQYFLVVLFLLIYNKNHKQFLNYLTFLLALIYIYSGLHKINGGFIYNVWESMILKRFFGLSSYHLENLALHYAGLLLGMIEFAAGLGLLYSKFKKVSALLLITMHLFILILISPIGLNYNVIVWPWNIAMILFLYFIFVNQNENEIAFGNLIEGYNKVFFIVIGIFPILSFFGYWDNYLSFNLYSGNTKNFEICIPKDASIPEYKDYISKKSRFCKTSYVLNGNQWALKEMNVTISPKERLFKEIFKKWKQKNPNAKVVFYTYHYPYQSKDFQFYN